MKIVFRPFGVGVEDVDTKEIKAHASRAWAKVMVTVNKGVAVAKPHVLNAAEVGLRHTVNGIVVVSNAIADVHKAVAKKQAGQ